MEAKDFLIGGVIIALLWYLYNGRQEARSKLLMALAAEQQVNLVNVNKEALDSLFPTVGVQFVENSTKYEKKMPPPPVVVDQIPEPNSKDEKKDEKYEEKKDEGVVNNLKTEATESTSTTTTTATTTPNIATTRSIATKTTKLPAIELDHKVQRVETDDIECDNDKDSVRMNISRHKHSLKTSKYEEVHQEEEQNENVINAKRKVCDYITAQRKKRQAELLEKKQKEKLSKTPMFLLDRLKISKINVNSSDEQPYDNL